MKGRIKGAMGAGMWRVLSLTEVQLVDQGYS